MKMETRLMKPAIEGFVTKTGYTIDVLAVPYVMVETLRQEIKDPPVPTIMNKTKGTLMENPQDPKYLQQIKEVEERRDARVKDAALAFGVKILDPSIEEGATWPGAKHNVPSFEAWRDYIESVEMMMDTDIISTLDISSGKELKIAFLKYIVLANPVDLSIVLKKSIGLWDAAQVSLDSFRDKALR